MFLIVTGLCCDSIDAVDCCGLFCTLPGQLCCPDGAICGAGQECCGNDYCAPAGNQCCGDGSTNCPFGLLCVLVAGIQKCCENTDCSAGGAVATSVATITTDVPGSSVTSAAATATTATETTASPVAVAQNTASSSVAVTSPTSAPVIVTKHSDAAAIGAGIGVPVALLLLAAIGFFFYRKGKKDAQTQRPQFQPEVTIVPSVQPGKPQEPPSPMSPMSPAPPQYTQATGDAYFNPGNPPEMPSPQQQPQQFYNHHPNMGPSSPQQQSYNQHPEMGPSSPQHFYNQYAEIGSSSQPQQPPPQQGRGELPAPNLNHPSPHGGPGSPPLAQRKPVPSTHSELQ
jgi:hypothetical protein